MLPTRSRDHHFSPAMLGSVLLLLVASVTDAVLTILLVREGASEINPVMDCFLEMGEMYFLLGKYALTVGGLPVLLIFRNHGLFGSRLRVAYLIPVTVLLYAVLISYQLSLMHRHVGM